MKYLVNICLVLIIASCTETEIVEANSPSEELPSEQSFTNWLEDSPSLSIKNDTLFSDPTPTPKDCEQTLPNVECFYGHYFSESRQDGSNPQHFMINSYLIDSVEVLYLEVFNNNGRRIFSRSIFDYEFIKEENHFSKFYQNGRWFILENCIRQDNKVEIITTRKIDIYGMSES